MDYLLAPIAWLFWTIIAVAGWVVSKIFWIFVWLVLPFALAAFVMLRIAESVLGQDAVRAWVKAKSMTYGAGAWTRLRRLTFALGVLPLRVIGWFVVYAIWYSMLSIFWTPRWRPWPRAWAKRWKPPTTRTRTAKAR